RVNAPLIDGALIRLPKAMSSPSSKIGDASAHPKHFGGGGATAGAFARTRLASVAPETGWPAANRCMTSLIASCSPGAIVCGVPPRNARIGLLTSGGWMVRAVAEAVVAAAATPSGSSATAVALTRVAPVLAVAPVLPVEGTGH